MIFNIYIVFETSFFFKQSYSHFFLRISHSLQIFYWICSRKIFIVSSYSFTHSQGNYIYFSTRKDYSIFRLLKMLFRLNFLVFCVMAVTDHVFVRYYICAMHTYWFLSVWVVMFVMNRYNKVFRHFLFFKFFIYL